jgi:hypothetical protein
MVVLPLLYLVTFALMMSNWFSSNFLALYDLWMLTEIDIGIDSLILTSVFQSTYVVASSDFQFLNDENFVDGDFTMHQLLTKLNSKNNPMRSR